MGKNFRETLNEQMKDPEFRAEWEAQEPEEYNHNNNRNNYSLQWKNIS